MTESGDYRKQFDRFAQDRYLTTLRDADPDAVIPTLFFDLMNRVNMIQGKAGLILAEIERSEIEADALDRAVTENNTVKVMEGAVDMANILKALMEYYDLTQKE